MIINPAVNINGNAATATKLQTARTIAGVSFDGTANINIASTGLSDTANIAYLNAANVFAANTQTLKANVSTASALALYGRTSDDTVTFQLLNHTGTGIQLNVQADPTSVLINAQSTGDLLIAGKTVKIYSGFGSGLQIGSPSGGDLGAGTLNVASDGVINGNAKFSTTQNFSWNSKSVDTVYQAACDGFVVAYTVTSSGTSGVFNGLTDASNPPTTTRAAIGAASATFNTSSSFCMPVKKGDYYKVVTITSGGSGVTIFWVPLGVNG